MTRSLWIAPILMLSLCAAVAAGEPPVTPATDTEESFAEPRTGVVTARTLNVRAGPAIDKALITTVARERQFKVVGRKGKWLKVELPADITVWIMSKYVTLPQGGALPAAGTVNANNVRVRTGGDEKAPILRQLDIDTQLEVLEKSNDWLKIKAPAGTFGWVHSNYVKFGGEAPVPPPVVETGPKQPPVSTGTGTVAVGPEKPPPVEPPENPPVVELGKEPGVATFAEAEAAYRRAQAGNNAELPRAFLLYYQAEQTPGVPAQVKRACGQRMAKIAPHLTAAQKKQIDEEVRRILEARIAAERAKAADELAKLPRIAAAYDAVGFLDRAPEVGGLPGTHKLSLSGVLLFYLQAANDKVDLDKLEGRKVGVIGRRRFVKGWGIEVIDVTDAQEYQEPPSTTIRLETEPEPVPEPAAEPDPAPAPAPVPETEAEPE